MQSVKNQDKRDMDGIIGNVNEEKTKKMNSFLLQIEEENVQESKKWQKVGFLNYRERKCDLSRFSGVRTVGSLRAKK